MSYCINCANQLRWNNDYDTEDLGYEPGGIVSVWECSHCGLDYEIITYGCDEEDDLPVTTVKIFPIMEEN